MAALVSLMAVSNEAKDMSTFAILPRKQVLGFIWDTRVKRS